VTIYNFIYQCSEDMNTHIGRKSWWVTCFFIQKRLTFTAFRKIQDNLSFTTDKKGMYNVGEHTLLQTDFTIICELVKTWYTQLLSVQRIKQETDAVQSNHEVESIAASNIVSIFLKFVAGHPLGHEDAHISAVSPLHYR
jgi:hypothetical protein